jgi:hypothetical protein
MKASLIIKISSLSALFLMITFSGIMTASYSDPVCQSEPGINYIRFDTLEDYFIDIDPVIHAQGVRHLNESFYQYYYEPWQIPLILEEVSERLLKPGLLYTALSQYGFRLMGAPAGGIGPPLAGVASFSPILHSKEEFQNAFNDLLSREVIILDETNRVSWSRAGYSAKKKIVELILLLEYCKPYFDQFSDPILESYHLGMQSPADMIEQLIGPFFARQIDDPSPFRMLDAADLRMLSYATRVFMQNMERIMQNIGSCSAGDGFTSVTIQSVYGDIGLFGEADDSIHGEYALLLDLGGNDHYVGTFASSRNVQGAPGILIDLGGNDSYYAPEGDALCMSLLGAGLLIDLSGNDSYVSERPGLAASIYGYSALIDLAGNDRYQCRSAFSQGAAICGVSQLYDAGGSDSYCSKSYAQGFGGTKGVGMLVDYEGHDIYQDSLDLQDRNVANIAFVQGAAKGRWAEASDGYSLGGGCGILVDGAGDDQYTAASFSQGASYYFGTGLLYDRRGDDSYDALSHSQAYAAHNGLACLIEGAGDDDYNMQTDTARITQVLASGRDNAVGILLEITGDDQYHFGNRSLGIADMKGIGFGLDLKGNDVLFWHRNDINSNSLSIGKCLDGNKAMVNFRLFPVKTNSLGRFRDVY